ncbi:MAG: glycolate oxidase subunit GlcF [Alphaproteobacteria bacterium]|nr:glycolate oxidase subunit GlcF [Alphaproteobacteria bacterium]
MRTQFTPLQLGDPQTAVSAAAIRACVHCGFCNAACPTFQLLGDERDGPRGRIRIIQDMLEDGGAPSAEAVRHIDRCLSCLGCKSACPSGVDYMHLVDHAREHIAQHHRRGWGEGLLRLSLRTVLMRPWLFRLALSMARGARFLKGSLPPELARLLSLAEGAAQEPLPRPRVYPAMGARRMRVALLEGCVQAVMAPQINRAAIRVLNRMGVEVVTVAGASCCGAIALHLGARADSRRFAMRNIAVWSREKETHGLDAIVVTMSGCGVQVKDYGHLFRDDPQWRAPAASVSALSVDVMALIQRLDTPLPKVAEPMRVAYHAACSLQHGQGLPGIGERLLARAGFEVVSPQGAHLCCGAAGTYHVLQAEIADGLKARKAEAIRATGAQVLAGGNFGCLHFLKDVAGMPCVHSVELIDFAGGGPRPFDARMPLHLPLVGG